MKKKILIPTDFSKNAWNAITYAASLFKNETCTFYLLNVYNPSGYSLGDLMLPEPGTASYELAQTQSQNGLEKLIQMLRFREKNEKHTYKLISQYNDLHNAMRSIIEKRDINLVIMGTKGVSNHREALFGSNTITAMEKLRNCPVLGVPLDARVAYLKEIVFPTSFKTHYKRRELQYLVDFSLLQNANICVLYMNKLGTLTNAQKENKQLLEECLEGANYSFHQLEGMDPTSGTQHFVKSRESDMVAIVNRKHPFFESLFTKSMVKELGMFSKVPLLVMHDLRN